MSMLQIYRGDTKHFCLTFQDKKTHVPIPIDGGTIRLLLKETVEDEPYLVSKVKSDHEEPLNGKTSITLESEDTLQEPGIYYLKLVYTAANEDRTTLFHDRIEIKL